MKKFRSHVAIAVDGGGIRGAMVVRALAALEEKHAFQGKPCNEVFHLSAGTSTGSIISAGLASGLSGGKLDELYKRLGPTVFRRTLRSALWPFFKCRFNPAGLEGFLREYIGPRTMKQVTTMDLVITAFDVVENRTRFIKTGKREYAEWEVVKAVLASCAVPTYFPPVDGRFVDGGVGSYANPCYLAAYEACIVRKWKPSETTLVSLGTGRDPHTVRPGQADRFWAWQWLTPILDAFLQSADQEQVRVVRTFFPRLDFRRFQVDLPRSIPLDDAGAVTMGQLAHYGNVMAEMILKDRTDVGVMEGAHTMPAATGSPRTRSSGGRP